MTSAPQRFVDHIALWMRWRWFLIGVTFSAALLTFMVASLTPKIYRATAIVLPPFEGGAALPFLGGVTVDVFGANEVPASGLATLLKSRALKDRIQQHIDLMEHYEKSDLEKAYLAFEDHLDVEFESEESFGSTTIIAFKVYILDRDPAFCAKLLNVVIDEWDALCVELNRRGASLRRQFVEENLHQLTGELANAEDSLRRFQELHGIAAIEAQVQGAVASAVALEQKIAEARVAAEVLGQLYQTEHPLLKRARMELQGLVAERKKLQAVQGAEGLLLPLGGTPEVTLAYYRLFRQAALLRAVSEVLMQQYEQAKIQELKNTPALRIVDRGEVPLYKFKPRRILLMLIASVSALFLALIAIYFLDYANRFRGTEEIRWMEEIGLHLQADWRRIRSWLGVGRK